MVRAWGSWVHISSAGVKESGYINFMMKHIVTRIGRSSLILAGVLPIKEESNVSPPSQSTQDIISSEKKKTGWERVRDIFTIDEFENLSPELTSVVQGGFLGLLVGACYGGLNRSKVAYIDFVTKNQATQFSSHLEAKKKLQDQVTIGLAKGGFRWGWRIGCFTSTYMLISCVVAAYRGKSGIMEHVIGGILTGGMFKCSLGVRGVVVGSGLGAVLGGIAGVCTYGLLQITGYSMDEVMYHRKQFSDSRKKMLNDQLAYYGGVNEDPLVKQYIAKHDTSDLLPKEV